MQRSGSFLFGALIFAGIAVALLLWSGMIDLSKLRGGGQTAQQTATAPLTPAAPLSREAQLVNQMSEASSGGGFKAGFGEQDVRKWQVAEGDRLERFSLDPAGPAYARLTTASRAVLINRCPPGNM